MPFEIPGPFTGGSAQSCSYTAQFISKNAEAAKALGMTEAQYEKHLIQGAWGVIKGKASKGEMKVGDVLFRGKHLSTDSDWTASWADGHKIKLVNKAKGTQTIVSPEDFEMFSFQNPYMEWKLPGSPAPAVSPVSKSIGSLTDEDAAALFVKVKDDFVKAKGLNIKAASHIDGEVYESIAKQVGYTAAELAAKVERYKSNGNKLSALKKKVLSGKKTVKLPDPVDAADVPKVVAPEKKPALDMDKPSYLEDAEPIVTNKIELKPKKFASTGDDAFFNGHNVGSITEDYESIMNGSYIVGKGKKEWRVIFRYPDGQTSLAIAYPSKKAALHAMQKHVDGKFAHLPPKLQPKPVHVEASKPAVKESVEDLIAKDKANALVFADEDVAKAYIKAKDQLAASPDNPWTLYTQKNSDFEAAIQNLMEKEYGIDLSPVQIKQQIARYLASGKKLSLLKKKMASTGEHVPQADTLKKTKAQKALDGSTTTNAEEAAKRVETVASEGATPAGAKGKALSDLESDSMFLNLGSKIANYKGEATNYDIFLAFQKSTHPDSSVLDIIRAYDKKKAAQLGVPNENYYEKKIANWGATPLGKDHMLGKVVTTPSPGSSYGSTSSSNTNTNWLKDLPESSKEYPNHTSIDEARRIQRDMGAWNANEKDGLQHYTGGSYRAMNGFLRGTNSYINGTDKLAISKATSGMRATTERMMVRRGCDFRQFGLGSYDEAVKLLGKTVQDKGFLSTSVGPEAAFGGQLKLEIEVAKGTHGAFVKDISHFPHENEFLIARGTKYEVLSIRKGKNPWDPTTIRLRTIPGSHSTGVV